jgi:hypothetical protein
VSYQNAPWQRGGTAQFEPKASDGTPLKGWILDSARGGSGAGAGMGDDTAFTNSSTQGDPIDLAGGGQSYIVDSLDAPGVAFLVTHPNTGMPWYTTSGGLWFVDHLTAFSTDAPADYTVYGDFRWTFNVNGQVNAADRWQQKPGGNILSTGFLSFSQYPAPGAAVPTFMALAPSFPLATITSRGAYTVTYSP